MTFVAAIPISLVLYDNAIEVIRHHPNSAVSLTPAISEIESWWYNLPSNTLLHIPMLHGVVPEFVIPSAPLAFLKPAWSISLEWQFYLLAPLVFWLCETKARAILLSLVVFTVLACLPYIPEVRVGAFLPFHIEFFYLGGLLCFIYKRWPLPDGWWLRPFTNPVSMYLGKISYSIYLSHMLVIAVVQSVLIALFPEMSMPIHCVVLGTVSSITTVSLSAGLYKWIEVLGMALGRKIASFSKESTHGESLKHREPRVVANLGHG